MALIAGYLKTWRLKLSVAKTTSTAFHLNTKEARRKLTVNVNGSPLPHNPTPTYLGVKLDRQLTYKQHLDSLRAKVSSRNNLLRRLAGSSWGASPSNLRTGALALVYSAAEYASPAWSRSAHAKKLDITLNETMRIVTGCLKPTPTEFLPVLSGIAPAALRRENYIYRLVSKASQDPNHLVHKLVSDSQDLGRQRLPSRRPFSRHSASIGGSDYNTLQAWRTSWQQTPRPPPPTFSHPKHKLTPTPPPPNFQSPQTQAYHRALTFLARIGQH